MIVDLNSVRINKPSFIVFEGGNGVGKSTLLNSLANILRNNGANVVTTHEPGATKVGAKIRSLVKESTDIRIDPMTELFLFSADRAQHISEVIKPSLEQGSYVLCDRFFYSTLAFQGYGRGLDIELIYKLSETAIQGVKPDLVILVDLHIKEARTRQKLRRDAQNDRFEAEDDKFQNTIRDAFLAVANNSKQEWVILDGSKSPKELIAEVSEIFQYK